MNNKQRTDNVKRKTDNGKNNFYFFSLASTGVGISGGDRIFIELARNWSKKEQVNIITTIEGVEMVDRQKLKGKKLEIISVANDLPKNFLLKYLYKIFAGIKIGMALDFSNRPEDHKDNHHLSSITHYLYSSSEFWMDVFPAVLLKIRFPKVKWVATWYQTAPNPLKGFSEAKREKSYNFSAFLYWLAQLPIKPLIKLYADKVIVNNEDERKQFSKMEKSGNVIVLIGAVPLADIKKYKQNREQRTKNKEQKVTANKEQSTGNKVQEDSKIGKINHYSSSINHRFSAVFQGRFHPQKGVVELIDIWRKVVDDIPGAKLAMIGDGPLMNEVKKRIKDHRLQKNVNLFGYVFDGSKKYDIFANSKLVVHPAFYDSGGMATAEAMAFGVPAVGFNLKAYESYYPKGMVKVKDEDEFVEKIIKLLNDDNKRKRLGNEARKLIEKNYSWNIRAEKILGEITK